MAHVVTCRVWLYTQHAVHYDTLNMYIYIYILLRVMAHVVSCRVWLYTQHAVHCDALNMYIYIYIYLNCFA